MDAAGAAAPGDTEVLGRRIGAFAIDALLATVLMVVVGIALADRTDYAGALRDHNCSVEQDGTGESRVYCSAFQYHDGVTDQEGTYYILDPLPAAVDALGAGVLTFVVAPLGLGASVGKLALGLRVVRRDGSRAGLGSHVVRWLLLFVDGTVTLGVCGLATAVLTSGHQRVGDLVAGTFVVRKGSTGTAPAAA